MSERETNLQDELSRRDAELAARIAQTLDESAQQFDAATHEQLALLRHRALQHTRRRRYAGALALAASLLVLVATPWMLQQRQQDIGRDDAAYLSVDPEMLADMEMLQAIGEAQ